jgi:hypothetical protein
MYVQFRALDTDRMSLPAIHTTTSLALHSLTVKCTSEASGRATIAIEAPARGFDSLNVGVVVGVRV